MKRRRKQKRLPLKLNKRRRQETNIETKKKTNKTKANVPGIFFNFSQPNVAFRMPYIIFTNIGHDDLSATYAACVFLCLVELLWLVSISLLQYCKFFSILDEIIFVRQKKVFAKRACLPARTLRLFLFKTQNIQHILIRLINQNA